MSPSSSGGSVTGSAMRGCSSARSLTRRTPTSTRPLPITSAWRSSVTRRAELVAGARLARWAIELELPALLRLGRGEDQSGGRTRESILATALEAVLGAIYREGGLDAVRAVIGRLAAW